MNIFKKFNSILDCHRYLENSEVQPYFAGQQYSEKGRLSFTQTSDYMEADNLLLYGDAKTGKKIMEEGVEKERLNIYRTMPKKKIFNDVVGFTPHIPNYIAGLPLTMINAKNVSTKRKVINIYYNMSESCWVSATEIRTKSINLLRALLRIEAGGTRINLYTGSIVQSNGQFVGFFAKIKSAEHFLDVKKVAYPLCHPSFFRRHGFRFIECTEGVHKSFVGGYGRPCSDFTEAKKSLNIDKNDVCITSSDLPLKEKDNVAKIVEIIKTKANIKK